MGVSDHIIYVVEADVDTAVSEENASEPTNSEEKEEANAEEHRSIEVEV